MMAFNHSTYLLLHVIIKQLSGCLILETTIAHWSSVINNAITTMYVIHYFFCFICVVNVNLTLAETNFSRGDINCPGDTISYKCSVLSNSKTIELTWRVTLPGMMPIDITYDSMSILNTVDTDLGYNITTTLTDFTVDEYIESTIVFTVLRGVAVNGTVLECISENLDIYATTLFVNMSSGQTSSLDNCTPSCIYFGVSLHYCSIIIIVPLTPTVFEVSMEYFMYVNITITFEWDPPQGMGSELIVDYYLIVISPTPLSHPILNNISSSPWNVTVDYNTVYSVNITAVNCAGESGAFLLDGFIYGKNNHHHTHN